MAPTDISTELARRVVASIILAECGEKKPDSYEIIAILGELLSLGIKFLWLLSQICTVILKTLRLANTKSLHGNRCQVNIFDIIQVLPVMRADIPILLPFLESRQHRPKPSSKLPTILPLGRNLLRAFGDDEDEDEQPDQGVPRPVYLIDIYPPFPRSYTFRRTETRGIRENDKVLIAKAKAEQQRQVESNLYRLLSKTNSLPQVVRYDEESS